MLQEQATKSTGLCVWLSPPFFTGRLRKASNKDCLLATTRRLSFDCDRIVSISFLVASRDRLLLQLVYSGQIPKDVPAGHTTFHHFGLFSSTTATTNHPRLSLSPAGEGLNPELPFRPSSPIKIKSKRERGGQKKKKKKKKKILETNQFARDEYVTCQGSEMSPLLFFFLLLLSEAGVFQIDFLILSSRYNKSSICITKL